MAGIQVPTGIDTVNAVPADYKYGPYASLAAAKAAIPLALRFDGLTVQITGLGNYWWLAADLSDTGLIIKGSGTFSLPIVRYVELIQDASDATLMGGSSSNVYTTTQSAYDAANALQIALGGANKVVIKVGNTTAATVGNLVLAAAHNTNVEWVGISANDSVIGTITGNFATNARFTNITVGNITTTTAAITLNLNNSIFGIITTSDGGAVSLTLRDSTTGNIVTTTTTANASGNVTLTNCSASSTGTITQNATAANVGTFIMTSCSDCSISTITRNQISAVASFSVGAITLTSCSDIRFGAITSSMAFAASTGVVTGINVNASNIGIIFTGVVTIQGHNANASSDVVVTNVAFSNCIFSTQLLINASGGASIATAGRGGRINTLSITNCQLGSITRFGYFVTTPVVAGTIRLQNCFGGTATRITFLMQDVTLDTFDVLDCNTNTIFDIIAYGGTADMLDSALNIINCRFDEMNLEVWRNGATIIDPVVFFDKVICPLIVLAFSNPDSNFIARGGCDFPDFKLSEATATPFTIDSYITNSYIYFNQIGSGTVSPSFVVSGSTIDGELEDTITYIFVGNTTTFDFAKVSTGGTDDYVINGNMKTSNLKTFTTATVGATNNNSYFETVAP